MNDGTTNKIISILDMTENNDAMVKEASTTPTGKEVMSDKISGTSVKYNMVSNNT